MKKRILALVMSSLLGATVFAAPTTVLEKAQEVELLVYGAVQPGSLTDRVEQLQKDVFGSVKAGELPEQIDDIYHKVDRSDSGMTLREKVDALQWNYEGGVTQEPLATRVEKLERSVWGKPSAGSLESREMKLEEALIGRDFALVAREATLPQSHVFKIALTEPLSTKNSKEGQAFSFAVAEDVVVDNVLLVPKNTVGTGHITELQKPRSFGRAAKLDLVFDQVKTIDGTEFALEQGAEAKEAIKSEVKAAGASVAGAALLGPIGLIGGFFVKGQDIDYPQGTVFYVQPLVQVTSYGPVAGVVPAAPKSEPAVETKAVEKPAAESVASEATAKVEEVVKAEEPITEPKEPVVEQNNHEDEISNEPVIVIKRTK